MPTLRRLSPLRPNYSDAILADPFPLFAGTFPSLILEVIRDEAILFIFSCHDQVSVRRRGLCPKVPLPERLAREASKFIVGRRDDRLSTHSKNALKVPVLCPIYAWSYLSVCRPVS